MNNTRTSLDSHRLTHRQREVLHLLAMGVTYAIGALIGVSIT